MPRRARLALAGVAWHIIQRGNNRSACFFADEDYRRYLDTLQEQADKYGCVVHAYVLMTNHVHLLVTPERTDSAALMMKNLGQRYVQYINRTYRRSGTLWEGRFKSCLVRNLLTHPRQRIQQRIDFGARFLQFFLAIRIRDDAAASPCIHRVLLREQRANRDVAVHVAVGVDVGDRAAE